MKRYIFFLIALLICCLQMAAQGTLSATLQGGADLGDGLIGMYQNDKLTLNISLSDVSDIENIDGFYVNDTKVENVSLTTTGGKLADFTYDAPTAEAKDYTLSLSIHYTHKVSHTVTEQGEEGPVEVVKETEEPVIVSTNIKYKVFSTPQASLILTPSATEGLNTYTYTFTVAGVSNTTGNPDGWHYEWSINGVKQSSNDKEAFTLEKPAAGNYTVTVRAYNQITASYPAREFTKEVQVTVYTEPQCTDLKINPSPNTVGYTKTAFTFTANFQSPATGNPNGWRYEWYIDDQKQPGSTNKLTTTLKEGTHTVSVKVHNEITSGRSSATEEAKLEGILVFSNPDASALKITGPDEHLISQKVTFTAEGVEEDTGNPDGWTYEWTVDSKSVKKSKEAFLDWKFEAAAKHYVSVNVYNTTYIEEKIGYYQHPIQIYSKPNISLDTPPTLDVVEGKTVNFKVKLSKIGTSVWSDLKCNITCEEKDVPVINGTIDHNTNTATFTFTPEKLGEGNSTIYHIINVQGVNSLWADGPLECSIAQDVRVWVKPEFTIANNENCIEGNHDRKGDETTILKVIPQGAMCRDNKGDYDVKAWSFRWTMDGEVKSGWTSDHINLSSFVDSRNHEYTVEPVCKVGNETFTLRKVTWKVTCWEMPESPDVEGASFEDDNITLKITPHYGYTGKQEQSGWEFSCTNSQGYPIAIKRIEKTKDNVYIAELNAQNITEVNLEARNLFYGELWQSFTVPCNITISKLPKVVSNSTTDFVYTYNSEKRRGLLSGLTNVYKSSSEFTLQELDGADRWRWNLKYIPIGGNNTSEQEISISSETNNPHTKNCRYKDHNHAVNGLLNEYKDLRVVGTVTNGNTWNEGGEKTIDIDITFRVWPEIKIQFTDCKVREGDEAKLDENLKLNDIYQHLNSGEVFVKKDYKLGGSSDLTAWIEQGDGQATSPQTSTCDVMLCDKNGNIFAREKGRQETTIYRRPQAPQDFMVLGNGATNTYIFDMGVDDSSLEALKYQYFVTDGQNSQSSNRRWIILSSSNWNYNKLLAATYWNYPDGTTIYSDYHNGTICDKSFTNGSRGLEETEETGITAIATDAPAVGEDIFDMTGRRITEPQRGRLYIVGGRKVIGK